MQVKTLILGAGLTGLSTAYHLEEYGQTDYLLVEKEPLPGGLCASTFKDNFVYDFGGHLLHLHTPYGKRLVKKLLKNNLSRLTRKAFVDFYNLRVPYPLQANVWRLPLILRMACAEGANKRPTSYQITSFREWCLSHFGLGFYRHFFKPYNTKLWGIPANRLTAEWCEQFIPTLTNAQLQQSFRAPVNKKYGYNVNFYYPKRGGIGALAGALADKVSHLMLSASVTQIDLKRKTAVVGGNTVHFTHLVNTLPLPEFIRLLKGEKALKTCAKKLAASPVTIYHLAINRKVTPFSWMYFPHADTPFYRVGLQSGFSSGNAPKNTSLFYIELPGLVKPAKTLENKIWNCLVQKGIIEQADRPLLTAWQQIPHAYATYNRQRTQTVDFLLAQLAQRDCRCGGRYGKWEYSFMESALLQGRDLARQLTGKKK